MQPEPAHMGMAGRVTATPPRPLTQDPLRTRAWGVIGKDGRPPMANLKALFVNYRIVYVGYCSCLQNYINNKSIYLRENI